MQRDVSFSILFAISLKPLFFYMKNALYLIIVGLVLFIMLQACTERMICPAYQSAFIHDTTALKRHFSYFGEDSMPKVLEASKDKFLIIEPVAYRKKMRSMQTVPMKDVYPVKEDSLDMDDDFSLAEVEGYGYDSTAVIAIDTTTSFPRQDSVYKISVKKEDFNIDQELYLWYLKDYLVYPDVRLQMSEADAAAGGATSGKKKGGFFSFFRNLFKKKKSDVPDSTNFDVETSATELGEDGPKKKKGLFNFLKKNRNKEQEPVPADNNEEGTPPEEDENDDF